MRRTGSRTPEGCVTAECFQWLRLNGFVEVNRRNVLVVAATIGTIDAPGIFWRNNTGGMKSTYKGRDSFTAFGISGMPDVWVLKRGGTLVGIELKAAKKKQNAAQVRWQEIMEAIGAKYVVARSMEDLEGLCPRV